MKIFAIICTRDSTKMSAVTHGLLNTLSSFGVETKLMSNQESIFEAYKKGLEVCKADPEDIIIMCHDDLQLLDTKANFIAKVSMATLPQVGIIGAAGTTHLGSDAVWWNHERLRQGLHRGMVKHVQQKKALTNFGTLDDATMIIPTEYGPHGQVVVLDGLFLAATKEVWEKVGLEKPDYFEGNWDFYDIHYTSKAHQLGYQNMTMSFDIIHQSNGDLVGRDSWHKNREAFINNTKLPLTC